MLSSSEEIGEKCCIVGRDSCVLTDGNGVGRVYCRELVGERKSAGFENMYCRQQKV